MDGRESRREAPVRVAIRLQLATDFFQRGDQFAGDMDGADSEPGFRGMGLMAGDEVR